MKHEYREIANCIRGLSIDAIQKANSGHPGLPLGMADIAAVLFKNFISFHPKKPDWLNRDRFVLSAGHGSMLLYSILHIFGYDLSIDEIKSFRQWGSMTAGHPEYGHAPGIETTTGPLGQGIGNAVGMAIGEAHISSVINTSKYPVIDHYTYVFAGDGDMMEGISHEVLSLAGHLKLNKLIVFFDYNSITIDGSVDLSSSDDAKLRFESYGWKVLEIDGHNFKQINKAIVKARKSKKKPVMIICKTTIGYGSPNKAGTSGVHGSPLGADEVKLTKKKLQIPPDDFYVSDIVRDLCAETIKNNIQKYDKWERMFEDFCTAKPEKYELLDKILNKKFDLGYLKPEKFRFPGSIATRTASQIVLNAIFDKIPNLIGGSADLTPSNNTKADNSEIFTAKNPEGRYLHYGVREHGMAAIMNGLSLYSGLIPYSGTFLVFSDYLRPSLRMAALMGIQSIFVFTHDSIGLGEDGPTHQPVEHINSLSLIPNVVNFRPMDAYETVIAWKVALARKNGPTNLILSRQNLPVYKRGRSGLTSALKAEKGAYVLTEDDRFDSIIIASGSEVEIALEAKKVLNQKGKKVRIVSMPSKELFDIQPYKYRDDVLPQNIEARVAIEAGNTALWYKYLGLNGISIGVEKFGASAPFKTLYENYGITVDNAVKSVLKLLKPKV